MPLRSTFSNLSSRGFRNSQGFAIVSKWLSTLSSASKTTGTTRSPASFAVNAGDLIVVACAWDPTALNTPTTVSLTDNIGTSYISAGALVGAPAANSSGTGTLVQVYYGIAPTSQSVLGITWSWNPTTVVASALIANVFYNVKPSLVNARTTSVVTTATATLGTGIANTGDLVLCVVGSENNSIATGASDTTRGTWSTVTGIASTGAGAATNQSISMQYKIVTANGVQTASWGGLGGNSALINLVFKAA